MNNYVSVWKNGSQLRVNTKQKWNEQHLFFFHIGNCHKYFILACKPILGEENSQKSEILKSFKTLASA